MEIEISSYDNGHRPTALGHIGDRRFVFRMMNGAWMLGVIAPGVENAWWHSPDEEFDFVASGSGDYEYPRGSLPHFIDGLKQYLRQLGLPDDTVEATIEAARAQATAIFDIDDLVRAPPAPRIWRPGDP